MSCETHGLDICPSCDKPVMAKSWRPEGWKNPYETEATEVSPGLVRVFFRSREWKAYEAGADAMLKALFEMAKASPTGTFIIDSKEQYLYFSGE